MNREILFRGKRVDKEEFIEEWVEGYYVCISGKYHYILAGNPIIKPGEVSVESYKVIPSTVGQYTGLTDRDGKKIFEGDIIKGKSKNVYAVEYSQKIAGFVTRGFGVLSTPCMNVGTMNYYEVIGNIHDNPELLEGKKNAE